VQAEFWLKNRKRISHLGHLGAEGTIILKRAIAEEGGPMWTAVIWLNTRNETSGSIKAGSGLTKGTIVYLSKSFELRGICLFKHFTD
jgi:hypothetical protein